MIKVRQVLLCSAVPFFFLAASCVRENSSRKQDIHVQQMSGFPNQEFGYELGVSACYAGIIGNKLVMAGGCNFAGKSAAEGGPKYFYKGIYGRNNGRLRARVETSWRIAVTGSLWSFYLTVR